jgi:RecA/RadA recombinase
MADFARVTSIDAVVAFRGALKTFEEDAAQAVLTLDEQCRRAQDWLDHDAPAYWRMEIKRCSDLVARTRSELETCRQRTVAGQRSACLEQEQAYRAAQQKLRMAEEKIEVVRKWANRIRRELDDYRGRTMGLRMALERDLPRTLGLLDRTIAALDAYVERTPPSESSGEAPSSASPPAAGDPS